MEKDVEDILNSIGLNVSRGHMQKLVKKFVSREKINYRYLTDSWLGKDGTVSYTPGVLPDAPDVDSLCKGVSYVFLSNEFVLRLRRMFSSMIDLRQS